MTKKFGDRVILEDLSFSIKEKETVVLIGSNGSGKSTAINMIVGFQRADQGDIVLGLSKSTWEAREKIRLCQQHDFLFDTLTFKEHLELTCMLRNIKKVR